MLGYVDEAQFLLLLFWCGRATLTLLLSDQWTRDKSLWGFWQKKVKAKLCLFPFLVAYLCLYVFYLDIKYKQSDNK